MPDDAPKSEFNWAPEGPKYERFVKGLIVLHDGEFVTGPPIESLPANPRRVPDRVVHGVLCKLVVDVEGNFHWKPVPQEYGSDVSASHQPSNAAAIPPHDKPRRGRTPNAERERVRVAILDKLLKDERLIYSPGVLAN